MNKSAWNLGLALLLYIGMTLACRAAPTVWYVATSGVDSAAADWGKTWDTAFKTISNAVRIAATDAGDTIVVSNGTYVLSEQITISKGVVLTGFLGRAQTVIDGNGSISANRCIYLNHSNAVVSGFTISNGILNSSIGYGAGVYILAAGGRVEDCNIIPESVMAV